MTSSETSGPAEDGSRSSGEQSRVESSEPTKVQPENTAELEQWRFYGQTTLNVRNRRLKNNRFYLGHLIALLGFGGVGVELSFVGAPGVLVIGLVGFFFSVFWLFYTLSYRF